MKAEDFVAKKHSREFNVWVGDKMRKKLAEFDMNKPHLFYGTFNRFGQRSNGRITILLTDIKDYKGNIITDHIWFPYTKSFYKVNLYNGCVICFQSKVELYFKGNLNDKLQLDFNLSDPTYVKEVTGGFCGEETFKRI